MAYLRTCSAGHGLACLPHGLLCAHGGHEPRHSQVHPGKIRTTSGRKGYAMSSSIENILALYDQDAPLEMAYTIPAAWYVDERIASLENHQVFGSNWIAVGRTDQVATAGQFFTFDLAGEPLVIVRGTDNKLRAFFNVCRHHAAAVATAPCGVAQLLRCPYHGWTYGLDGSLKGTPEFAGVCNFERADNGLVPVSVAVWESFIFVNLNPHAPALESYLGNLPERFAPLSISTLGFFARKSYTLDCNWKVYVDNYLDGGYHVPHMHKGLNSVLDYTNYTIENVDRCCVQSSPVTVDSTSEASAANTRKGNREYFFCKYPNF